MLDGIFSKAFWMHSARLWQTQRISTMSGFSSLILDHNEFRTPTMLLAPSVPSPVQSSGFRQNSSRVALTFSKRASSVVYTTGTSLRKTVQTALRIWL